MPPVMLPTVQENELGVDAVNEILGAVPLHIVAVFAMVTEGIGFIVTAIPLLSTEASPVQPGFMKTVTIWPFCRFETANVEPVAPFWFTPFILHW